MNLLALAVQTHRARSPILHWLVGWGAIGLFAVAVVDSSVIPLPLPGSTDLLLLLLAAHGGNPILLAGVATAGSIVGGYLTWVAGRRGGEAALSRRSGPKRLLARVSDWMRNHGSLSVAIAAILPPPIPLLPFLLAAGALGVTRKQFLWSFSVARALRYGLLAWLGATYGRHEVRAWQRTLAGWSTPILSTYVVLLILGVAYGVWTVRQRGTHVLEG